MSSPEASLDSAEHQAATLRQACQSGLQQCQQLMAELSAADYVSSTNGAASIGAHTRHVAERYQSFLDGLGTGRVDYDARARDRAVESSPQAATAALAAIQQRISTLVVDARPLRVRESVQAGAPATEADSTVARELLGLVSHTTHHQAMIAMLARPLGYELDADFGKAASTVINQRRNAG